LRRARNHSGAIRAAYGYNFTLQAVNQSADKALNELAAAFFSGIPPARVNTGHGAGRKLRSGLSTAFK